MILKNSIFLHGVRVAILSLRLCKRLKLSVKKTFFIFVGAILHDVGKLKVDKFVLNKPDVLTAEEFEVIKTHVDINLKCISNQTIRNIILYHHENVDGSGYKGLTFIPFESKVVRICDVFDALTHDRIYHTKILPIEALETLIKEKIIFDNTILSCFIEMVLCDKSYNCNYNSCLKKLLNDAR